MKKIVRTGHFIICHLGIMTIVGTMSLMIYPPTLPQIKPEITYSREKRGEREGNGDKREIARIKGLLEGELLIERGLAEEIAVSIHKHTRNTDISPELIVAVMKIESDGRPDAVSPAGAIGLLQIMPFWKKVLNIQDADLFDTDTNIRIGINVLHIYMERYKRLEKALAAYNGSLGSRRYPQKVLRVYKRVMNKELES